MVYNITCTFFTLYHEGKADRCQLSRAGLATYSTHAQNGAWHSLLSKIFLFISPDQRPYIVKNMCTYTHMTAQNTIYELLLLPNNTAGVTFLHKSVGCEDLTGYLSLGRRPGGDWEST